MNFFADESLDRQIIARLRQGGHAVLDVTEIDPGISDDTVLSTSRKPVCKPYGLEGALKRMLQNWV